MIDFVVFTLGCKVNTYEGQAMITRLIEKGFLATDELVEAKNYIINTCSVTSEADKKSRQMIARARKLNKNANMYVCGCSSQNDSNSYVVKSGVRIVGGASGKTELVDKIIDDIQKKEEKKELLISPLPKQYENVSSPMLTRTRGLIKIQDGCNNFCSYCIIPYLRGRSRSREIDKIVDEAIKAAEHSNEIVLTGINVSAYGLDTGSSLLELIKALGKVGVRKRIGSLECHVIDESLVRAMQDNGFCDHFHLSMQSGSDSVLKRMNRHYTSSEFVSKTDIIRKIMPNAGITTDIIVGFGGETDAEFEQTVEVVKRIKFLDAHIFPYSERKGTKAALLPQIDKQIRVERAKALTEVKNEIRASYLKQQIGKQARVYFEDRNEAISYGYTSNYIKVYANKPEKALKDVIITDIYKDGLKGE